MLFWCFCVYFIIFLARPFPFSNTRAHTHARARTGMPPSISTRSGTSVPCGGCCCPHGSTRSSFCSRRSSMPFSCVDAFFPGRALVSRHTEFLPSSYTSRSKCTDVLSFLFPHALHHVLRYRRYRAPFYSRICRLRTLLMAPTISCCSHSCSPLCLDGCGA